MCNLIEWKEVFVIMFESFFLVCPTSKSMGFVWSALGFKNTGRTDDPDPVTGLTSRDRYLVKSSYEAVRKNPVESGVSLLNLLFKNHPEALQLFPFKDIPLDELPKNRKYQAHCNSVIYGFSAIVDAIDDVELLVPILNKVGESHQPRKVNEESFLQLKDTIIELFSTFMTPLEIASWKKTLDVAISVINKAVKDKAAA
nr:extracellular globin-E1-like isoform X1 [Leptinotarsa decemlineata]